MSIRYTLCMTSFKPPLFKCLSYLIFWLSSFFLFSGREEIYPVVPARLTFIFVWAINSTALISLMSGFEMLGHIVLHRGIFKEQVNTWKTSSWIHACCFSVYQVSPLFFFILLYPLCKWPQPNSQWVMGVNCNWKLLCVLLYEWRENTVHYCRCWLKLSEFDQKVWLGHLMQNVTYVNKI